MTSAEASAGDRPQFGYPVVLDLRGVPVLLVGGGPVAARKVAGLADAGASVTVVAPEVSREMEDQQALGRVVRIERREFRPTDLDSVRLVLTATGVDAVDHAVAEEASRRGLWVNAADLRAGCSFILPAIARRDRLSVALSTDGASPALAVRLRDRAAELLTDDVAELAGRLAAERAQLHAAGRSTERHDWSSVIDPVLPPVDRPDRPGEG